MLILIVTALCSMKYGAVCLSLDEIISAFSKCVRGEEVLTLHERIFMEIRLPRAILCIFVGAALAVGGLTAMQLLLSPRPTVDLSLLSQYFAGYAVSWAGVFVGAAWGFATGFCAGWLTAFVRNLVLALSLFMIRSKAELADSRNFLDHI